MGKISFTLHYENNRYKNFSCLARPTQLIGDQHNASVRGTRYHSIIIPKINLKAFYREIIQQQSGSDIADLQKTFNELLGSLDAVRNNDLKDFE